MELITEDNFLVVAAKHYTNPYCLSYDEFLDDLKLISTISRMLAWMDDISVVRDERIKRLVNNTISFYNVFDVDGATELLEFKLQEDQQIKMNSVLYFLSLPLLGKQLFDVILHRRIAQEYK